MYMKKNVAIVYGGDSGEFDVSVQSGEVVFHHLDKKLFQGYLVMIKNDRWIYRDTDSREYAINKNDFTLELEKGTVKFDAVFNAIHGTPGEDGKLQGYLEMLHIPASSCDQATSALTFNKFFCNHFVSSLGVKVANSFLIDRKSWNSHQKGLQELNLPVFVKPNRGGSSVGTSKVKEASEFDTAVELAIREDGQVLVEEFIPGREITCGVIPWKGEVIALPVTEIVSKKEFFDYEAKYLGMSDEITPARIPEQIRKDCQETSVMLYRQLNCRGIVRCDYIFNDKGLYFLEINTVPGMSEASIVPQQAREQGISLKGLFTEVILDAISNR